MLKQFQPSTIPVHDYLSNIPQRVPLPRPSLVNISAGSAQHQENCKFAFSAFSSRISGNKRKKRGNYEIIKQDPQRSSAKSMKSSVQFS